jgi:hypothetical protein
MNANGFLRFGLAVGVTALIGFGQTPPRQPAKPVAGGVPGPVIRMDLLHEAGRPEASAKRDIFIPQSATAGGPIPVLISGIQTPMAGLEAQRAGEESKIPALSLRYVGFIQAKKKFIGLVLFEGQAMAVEEGDFVGQEWKIVRIAADALDIQGSDGKTQTFALEGERK